MSVKINPDPVVTASAQPLALSAVLTSTPSSDAAYIVVDVLDRDEYTAGASGATGALVGNGLSLGLTSVGGDARGAGIVFTYQASTGRYHNWSYGYLDQLSFLSSASAGDVADLSLWSTDSLSLATSYGSNAEAMMQVDPSGYLGTVTVATVPGYTGPVPAQATPDSIAAVAESFVGQSWNTNGCWVLCSTIAAEAGASLPVQSTAATAGQSNGEWFVAFDGPAGDVGDWQSMVTEGEMIGFETSSGTGHITTVVSRSGSSAMLVDNAKFVGASGVTNPASDGSPNDVTIEAPHAAAAEWSMVQPGTVVIYELDTPTVSPLTAALSLSAGEAAGLGPLFSAVDPAGKDVTAYQVYATDPGDTLLVSGASVDARSAASAVTVSSLAQVSLQAGSGGDFGTIGVRASNGTYWGDWASLGVTVAEPAAQSITTPVTPGTFKFTDVVTDTSGTAAGQVYSGPVAGLQSAYVWSGADSVAISAQTADVELVGGPASDALEANAGSNVLDGGTGSNFLVGATGAGGGADSFFVDGRGGGPFWDSLVNFHDQDTVTLWGFVPGSTMSWTASAGAPGYGGATLDVSLAGGTTGSITFAALSLAEAQAHLAPSSGSSGGASYLKLQFSG